jgi:hypothetical protein
MAIFQDVQLDKQSSVSCAHPVTVMVGFFGSRSREGGSGPVPSFEFISDKIFDIVNMVSSCHGDQKE